MPKLLDATRVTYGDVEYAIFPFPAMTAAGIMGDLAKYIGPIVSALMPLFAGGATGKTEEEIGAAALGNAMKMDMNDVVSMLQSALSTMDGESLQRVVASLLTKHGNITYEYRDDTGRPIVRKLTSAALDELFIGNLDCMLKLCVDVVRVNYSGFFSKLLSQYGDHQDTLTHQTSRNTEPLTDAVSVL